MFCQTEKTTFLENRGNYTVTNVRRTQYELIGSLSKDDDDGKEDVISKYNFSFL